MANSVSFLALSCVGFIASAPAMAEVVPVPAVAAEVGAADRADEDAKRRAERDDIVVTDQAIKPAAEVESPKAIAPLLDTPQTITVISDQTLRKQNLPDAARCAADHPRHHLRRGRGRRRLWRLHQPARLFGQQRHHRRRRPRQRAVQPHRSVQPPADRSLQRRQFGLQRLGHRSAARSTWSPRRRSADDLTIVQGAVGTDDYYRGAIDSNWRVGDADRGAPERGRITATTCPAATSRSSKRWGVAPSITIGIDGPTSLTLAYVHQQDDNTPIYGVPYSRTQLNDGPLPGVDAATISASSTSTSRTPRSIASPRPSATSSATSCRSAT